MASVITFQHEIVTLESVSEKIEYGLTTSATSSNTGIKFLRITDIQNNRVDWQSVPYCECNEKDFTQYSLAKGDIVFARTGATTGKSFLIKEKPEKTVFASYLIRVRANQNLVDPEFLSYFFQTPQYWQQISDTAVGAAQVGVNGSKLAELRLPLPLLPEQKRIASLLKRADRLRQLRRTPHDLGDSLLQSMFLEMFGDIVRNEKGWEIYPIEEYVNVQGGYSFKSEDFIKSGVKVVKITNVHYGHLTWQDDTEYLPIEYLSKYSAFSLKADDIVMSLTRPIIKSLNSVKVCRVQEADLPCLLNQRVGRLIIKDSNKLVPEYLLQFCYSQYFKTKVDDFLSESLQPNIRINQVGEIQIPVPPLRLQQEFASVVRRVESLRGRMSEAGRQVDGLFESLLSESFSGGI